MFLQRLITTLILVPLVLLLLFYANSWVLSAVLLILYGVVIQEFCQLIPLKTLMAKGMYFLLLLLSLGICYLIFPYWLVAGLIIWGLMMLAIIGFPASEMFWGYPSIVAGLGALLLPLFIHSMAHVYLLPEGKALLLYVFCLVWAADIGAYLTGKRWGTHRLIPKVSPGKSWEGIAGGVLLVLLVAWIGTLYFKPTYIMIWFLLALIVAVISIFGDLFMSMLKRRCHVKDTGFIIPGHGGILDRLDSVIAAVPVFYFVLGWTLG